MNMPVWIARPPRVKSQGVDRLWLRQPGLTMANALLPGLTNTTQKARYFTVAAWLLANARDRQHLGELEIAWVQAMRWHGERAGHPLTGIGRDQVPSALAPSELGWPKKERPSSLYDAVYYGPSTALLGIGERPSRGSPCITPLGQGLAAAARVAEAGVVAPGATHLAPDAAAALSTLCLCGRPSPEEAVVLAEVLFRMEARRAREERLRDGPRRRSLALILATAEGRKVDPVGRSLLQTWLDHGLGREGWASPPALAEECWGFSVLALRWYVRHALESAWAAFGRMVLDTPSDGPSLRPFVDRALAASNDEVPFRPLAESSLEAVLRDLPDGVGAEGEGHASIEGTRARDPAAMLLSAATQLLALVRRVPALEPGGRHYRRFLDEGGVDRLSLAYLFRRSEDFRDVASWVQFVMERLVVAQHLRAAAFKASEGSHAYNFTRGELGFELVHATWDADAGRTKVPVSLSLLRDLGFLRDDAGVWRRTTEGDAMLAAVLADPGVRRAVPLG